MNNKIAEINNGKGFTSLEKIDYEIFNFIYDSVENALKELITLNNLKQSTKTIYSKKFSC